MVPLFERHLSLSQSGITTKGVNSRGTHPQPSHKCVEEVADIHISPREIVGHCMDSLSPSPLPLRPTILSSMSAPLPPQGPLDHPGVTCVGCHLSLLPVSIWRASNASCSWSSSRSQTSLVSSIQDPNLGWACWVEAGYPPLLWICAWAPEEQLPLEAMCSPSPA